MNIKHNGGTVVDSNLKYRDGHIHTEFCPHANGDIMEQYVEEALKNNLVEMTFTEHMPLPGYFLDDQKFQDMCATPKENMMDYFKKAKSVKEMYKDKIKINIGMEVDFVDGFEEKTKELLNEYGPFIEDGLLSVHYIKIGDKYTDIDGKDGFERAVNYYGSIEKVYDKYYETILKAVKSNLGKYKPKRIGHPNLIRTFNKLFPIEYKNYRLLDKLAKAIKKRNFEVDVNTSGLRKPYCKEVYVEGIFYDLVKKYGIKMVYGSDAHSSKDIAASFSSIEY